MRQPTATWQEWRQFFLARRDRGLPEVCASIDYSELPESLARSLAIFQLGESGGGTVVSQASSSGLNGVNEDYAAAVELFVREENRHADLLENCLLLLGGDVITENWTAKTFVKLRRLMGLRLKITVLLIAEVVGICYYHLLASRLADCEVRSYLLQLAADERAHLQFHCDFLRSQTTKRWQRWVFVLFWRCASYWAGVAVLADHGAAIRDMGLSRGQVWLRWRHFAKQAEISIVRADWTADSASMQANVGPAVLR